MFLSLSWNKERNQRNPDSYRDKAADNFGAPVFRLAHEMQLPQASLGVKQYCLLLAFTASLKTVAISQSRVLGTEA